MTSKPVSTQRVIYIILHQIFNFLLELLQTEQLNSCTHDKLFCLLKLFYPSVIIFHCTCRQELLQAREKHKEEQVMALKRSMQSGMVSFLPDCFYGVLTLILVILLTSRSFFSCFCALIYRHRQWKSKLNSGRRWLTSTSLETLRWELQIKLYLKLGF